MAISTGTNSANPTRAQTRKPLCLLRGQRQGARIRGQQAGESPLVQQEHADHQDPHDEAEHHQAPSIRGQPMAETGKEVAKLQRLAMVTPPRHRHPASPHTM